MRDDEIAGQSLLLAQQETAHREHLHIHQLQHDRLHKRQAAASTVVTEVVSTVSVIQQVDVDSNGSTFAIQTVPLDSTADTTPALTDASLPATTTAASPSITDPGSAASSTAAEAAPSASSAQPSQSLQSGQSAVSVPTSTHSNFASLIVSSNSTTLISSSSSLLPTFSNSTIPSSSRSSLTYLTSSTNPSSDVSSITSTSFPYSPSSSSYLSTSTSGIDGILAGGTGAASGSKPSSTAGSGSGSDSGSGSSTTTTGGVIAGGVVGGLAGAAVILFLLLFLIRWKKRNMSMLPLGSSERGGTDTLSGGGPSQTSGNMVERRSMAYAVPAALASLTGYKRFSQKTETDRTISSTAGSERGFYRVSGRKLPSVLHTGGDGYGGGIPDANTLSGSSFYRDSQGFYGGPGSPSTPSAGKSRKRESGIPIMRPSPARTPVTEQGPFSEVPPPLNPPARPDQLGRSHPSQDGSHASKFTEEV